MIAIINNIYYDIKCNNKTIIVNNNIRKAINVYNNKKLK